MRTIANRVPHILKALKKTQTMSSFIFFDTETSSIRVKGKPNVARQVLNFGFAYSVRLENKKRTRESWLRFVSGSEFWKWVISKLDLNRPIYLFAHNLGFDLTISSFWDLQEQLGLNVEFFVFEDPPTIVNVSHSKGKIVMIDSFNFWRAKLAVIGESMGIEKLEMPKANASKKEWDTYARRDVEILAEAVLRLVDYVNVNELGSIGLTAPSLAMNAYRRRFMKHEIYIHDNIECCQLERDSYFGGRVECFHVGEVFKKEIYNLDVNSLYPSVMLNVFPNKLLGMKREATLEELKKYMRDYVCIAKVKISSPSETFPCRFEDKLCFTKGTFITTLAQPELERAFRGGFVKDCFEFAYYEYAFLFKEYVKFFWKERQEYKKQGNKIAETFTKLLLNSLYGKFGQNGYSWVDLSLDTLEKFYQAYRVEFPKDIYNEHNIVPLCEPVNKVMMKGLKNPVPFRAIAGKTQIKFPIQEHHESFPAVASFVTSYARERLNDLISIAGPDNVLYCDTDSLFVLKEGYNKLKKQDEINNLELGKLKLVEISKYLRIYGLKDYIFGDKVVMKGIRSDAIKIDDDLFLQNQFEGLKSVLNRGGQAYIDISWITKQNHREYNKGTILRDGRVVPLNLRIVDGNNYVVIPCLEK